MQLSIEKDNIIILKSYDDGKRVNSNFCQKTQSLYYLLHAVYMTFPKNHKCGNLIL